VLLSTPTNINLVPSTASWLSEREKAFIQARLPSNSPRAAEANFNLQELITTLKNKRICSSCYAGPFSQSALLAFHSTSRPLLPILALRESISVCLKVYYSNGFLKFNWPSTASEYPLCCICSDFDDRFRNLCRHWTYPSTSNSTLLYDCD
jgi:hypothetical protein